MKHPWLLGSMNQLANVYNEFQGDTPKILFVCSAGLLRSPTAAHLFSSEPYNLNTRAAGSCVSYALIPVSDALMAWADKIIFMQTENKEEVEMTFGKEFLDENGYSEKMYVLEIPDNSRYRDSRLIEILKEKVDVILTK